MFLFDSQNVTKLSAWKAVQSRTHKLVPLQNLMLIMPPYRRLNFQETSKKSGSWSARTNDANQWLQIDLGNQLTKVTRLASQGRNYNPSWPYGAHSQWVTKYKVQYSNDGSNFQNYKEQGQSAEKVKTVYFTEIFLWQNGTEHS